MGERINLYNQRRFFWYPWGKLFNRDLVVKNDVKFPNWPTADDTIFCFKCLCLAKNYVRIPSITNVYRTRGDSLTNETLNVPKYIHRWINIIVEGTRIIDEFMNGFELFVAHPEYKLATIDAFVQEKINWLLRIYDGNNIQIFDNVLRSEFNGDRNNVLNAYLISTILRYRMQLINLQLNMRELSNANKQRKDF